MHKRGDAREVSMAVMTQIVTPVLAANRQVLGFCETCRSLKTVTRVQLTGANGAQSLSITTMCKCPKGNGTINVRIPPKVRVTRKMRKMIH